MSVIWWIASYPKSGNTKTRMFLSAYRNGGQVQINRPYGALLDDCYEYFHQAVSPVALDKLEDHEKLLLRPAALMHLSRMPPAGEPCFVKTHCGNGTVGGIPLIPAGVTLGAVYIVRDPRDVAVSAAEHNGIEIDEMIANMDSPDYMLRRPPLFQLISRWSDHVISWTERMSAPVCALRFEDMLASPATVMRQMLAFLHQEIDEELLDKALAASSFEALRAQEDAHGFREKVHGERFFREGRPGAWRKVLSEAQIAAIERAHGEVMRRWDYELVTAEAA